MVTSGCIEASGRADPCREFSILSPMSASSLGFMQALVTCFYLILVEKIVLSVNANHVIVMESNPKDVDVSVNLIILFNHLSVARVNWQGKKVLAVGRWTSLFPKFIWVKRWFKISWDFLEMKQEELEFN